MLIYSQKYCELVDTARFAIAVSPQLDPNDTMRGFKVYAHSGDHKHEIILARFDKLETAKMLMLDMVLAAERGLAVFTIEDL